MIEELAREIVRRDLENELSKPASLEEVGMVLAGMLGEAYETVYPEELARKRLKDAEFAKSVERLLGNKSEG